MTGPSTTRLPSDPLHPDNEMYQRVLTGVQGLGQFNAEQSANVAAALYADIRSRQPHMAASDIGQIVAGDPKAPQPSVFALPRADYHSHNADPAALRFTAATASATRPAQESLAPYGREISIGADGFLTDPGITRTAIPRLERGEMPQVDGIVLHRTESSTASSTLNAWRNDRPYGTHFLIDKDGTIHQTSSLNRQTAHVGPIRSRGEDEGTIPAAEQRELDAARRAVTGTSARVAAVNGIEADKPYPERYPSNRDSVGIEVVGRYNQATQTWDAPTPEQTASIQRLVGTLQNNFGLTDHDVYQHDRIAYKTAGEGAGLYTPAAAVPAADPAGVSTGGPTR